MKAAQYILTIVLILSLHWCHADNGDKYRIVAHKTAANEVVSISNTVIIAGSATVYIPNAFTPDGDGLNDMFGALATGLNEYQLLIFNRWGELIFQSEDLEDQWNGTYQGQPAPDGVYVYKLYAMADGYERTYKTGSVTLIR